MIESFARLLSDRLRSAVTHRLEKQSARVNNSVVDDLVNHHLENMASIMVNGYMEDVEEEENG